MTLDYIRRGQSFDILVDISGTGATISGATLRTVFRSGTGHEVIIENDDHIIVSPTSYRVIGNHSTTNKFKETYVYTFVTEYQIGTTDSWIRVDQKYKVENSSRASESTDC